PDVWRVARRAVGNPERGPYPSRRLLKPRVHSGWRAVGSNLDRGSQALRAFGSPAHPADVAAFLQEVPPSDQDAAPEVCMDRSMRPCIYVMGGALLSSAV